MISERKRISNQVNGRRGRGPKTKNGKARSRQNALRHGLSAINRHHPSHGGEIRRIAEAICEGNTDGPWFEAALVIAECQVIRNCLYMERNFRIERLRDASAYPFSTPVLVDALHKLRRNHVEWLKMKARLIDDAKARGASHPFSDAHRPPRKSKPDRDELAALGLAIPDLIPLERYDRRAWSRQRRAIKEFMSLKARARNQ